MVHNHYAVAREVDVELEPISAKREAVIERDDGVFGAKGCAAAMSVHERTRGLAQEAYCNMPYDLGTSLHTW